MKKQAVRPTKRIYYDTTKKTEAVKMEIIKVVKDKTKATQALLDCTNPYSLPSGFGSTSEQVDSALEIMHLEECKVEMHIIKNGDNRIYLDWGFDSNKCPKVACIHLAEEVLNGN